MGLCQVGSRRPASELESQTVGDAGCPVYRIEAHRSPYHATLEYSEVKRRLSVIQQAEAAVEANLTRAERLRQSILKQAFSGKLVPQDPNDEPASTLLECIRAEREAQAQASASGKGKSGCGKGRATR